jgi:RNA polymerase sigma-70 factor (ECF subfamily)
MNLPETEMGGPSRSFPATSWTLIEEARAGKARGESESFKRLVELYWKPVYGFIRQSGPRSNEDAKDLTQEFFARIVLDGSLIERYRPGQGGFRPFLKTAVRNFLHQEHRDASTQKKGGGAAVLSLSGPEYQVLPDPQGLTPEEAFDGEWERAVLAEALKRLERSLRAEGKEAYWEVFRSCEMPAARQAPSYQEIGDRLHLTRDTVKNYLTAARKAFLEAAKQVVVQYVDNPEDLSKELAALFRK